MRNLVIVLMLAGAGYLLYAHPGWWRKYIDSAGDTAATPASTPGPDAGADATPGDFKAAVTGAQAWRYVVCEGNSACAVEVALMDGERWRVEGKKMGNPNLYVAVCDGSNTVANPPSKKSPSALDPRNMTGRMLTLTAAVAGAASRAPSQVTESVDGHLCWKVSETVQGVTSQLWVDSTSRLPVAFIGSQGGRYFECHLAKLPVDVEGSGGQYFNTDNKVPMFANYLTDAAISAALSQHHGAASAPAGGIPRTHYLLKEAVTVATAYGPVTIPAGTEVRIVSQAGDDWRVSGGGQEFSVHAGQVETVQQ